MWKRNNSTEKQKQNNKKQVFFFEKFSADRVADRILDMGDIVGIVEKAEQEFDEKEAEKLEGMAAWKARVLGIGIDDVL